jgi:hypothetical protein
MLAALVEEQAARGRALAWLHTVAARDPREPLPRAVRRGVAERLALRAGMTVTPAPSRTLEVDPKACLAVSLPPGGPSDLMVRISEWAASS